MKHPLRGFAAAVLLFASLPVLGKVSADEAARLGKDLTPIGAEKAGNGAAIPAWTGGLPRQGELSGAYPKNAKISADKPLFTITKDNLAQHADKLTEGHKALFSRYGDTYKMHVYPTHRPVAWPEEIYASTKANATTAVLEGTDDIRDANLGFPFPIPGTAAEVIWNHKVRWRGDAVTRYNNQAIVQADGGYQITKLTEWVKFKYGSIKQPTPLSQNMNLLYLSEVIAPPRLAGQLLLVHETMNQVAGPRQAWIYNPGLRRTRRAPNVAYDNPYEGTDGNQFNDQVDMYNGAMDRYTWNLVGKKEMYIPYNSYKIASPDVSYEDIIEPRHINQDLARYELHRVWVVDSQLREGTNHTFGRRTFYVDEDSWTIAAIDCYDKRGQMYKVQEAHLVYAQSIQTVGGTPEIIYDLQSGRTFLTALANEDKPNDFSVDFDDRDFTSKTLAKKATR
mgnify:CR=1 FL=1